MTSKSTPKKTAWAIAAVLVLGLVLGGAILGTRKAEPAGEGHGHAEHTAHAEVEQGKAHDDGHGHGPGEQAGQRAAPSGKGPHGGKLFIHGDFSLELTIFETGVDPEFRVYAYRGGKPLPADQTRLTVTLERLGRAPEVFRFSAEKDYLKGSAVVEEPHSFAGTIQAESGGKSHEFKFEQIEARVQVTDEQLQRNGVEIATAGPARIRGELRLLGEVKLNQDRTVFVTPRLAGLVEAVHANAGDKVRRGQVLAVISSQALADQRSELLAARKRLALAEATHEREKRLWEEKISAEQDFLAARQVHQEAEIAAESARQKLASLGAGATASSQGLTRYEVRSPIDGVVIDKKVSVGEVLKEDAPIFQVADLSTVWVELDVPAAEVNRLEVGAEASVEASAFEAQARARLAYVGALVGEQSRRATARLVLPNPKGVWRPGLAVDVTLTVDEVEVPVAVSAEAVQSLKDWSVVFGRYGTSFEARPLVLGRSDGRFVEVLKGLRAGERYAARNSFLIKADIGKSGASHDH
jgi:cobalt-zinc-cadmium efflux system membrane fusion protein